MCLIIKQIASIFRAYDRMNINNSRLTYFNEIFWTEDHYNLKTTIPHHQPFSFFRFFSDYTLKEKKNLYFFSSLFKYNARYVTHLSSGIKDFFSFLYRSFNDLFFFSLASSSSLPFIFHLYVSNIFFSSSFFLPWYGLSLMC